MRHYQVRDVMTANPMTVTPATPLKNVADILVRGRIGVVPALTPHGRVAGVVAEGNLLRKEQLQRDPDGRHSMHLLYRTRRDIATAETAGELMDRYPATAQAGTSVAEAARLMDRHQSRFLLVTGEDGKLLGVVTARDLLRVFPPPGRGHQGGDQPGRPVALPRHQPRPGPGRRHRRGGQADRRARAQEHAGRRAAGRPRGGRGHRRRRVERS
jgi:FOG: CBS domain